jgi:hypothetical protein
MARWGEVRIFIPSTFRDMRAERDHTDEFVETRLDGFVVGERQPVVDQLDTFARGEGEARHRIVVGAPGSGKSTLFAHSHREHTAVHREEIRDRFGGSLFSES